MDSPLVVSGKMLPPSEGSITALPWAGKTALLDGGGLHARDHLLPGSGLLLVLAGTLLHPWCPVHPLHVGDLLKGGRLLLDGAETDLLPEVEDGWLMLTLEGWARLAAVAQGAALQYGPAAHLLWAVARLDIECPRGSNKWCGREGVVEHDGVEVHVIVGGRCILKERVVCGYHLGAMVATPGWGRWCVVDGGEGRVEVPLEAGNIVVFL